MVEDIFSEINRTSNWNIKVNNIWTELENGKVVSVPDDINEASHYIKRLKYLMEHNQEKNRDKAGIEFYQKLNHYINLLESKIEL